VKEQQRVRLQYYGICVRRRLAYGRESNRSGGYNRAGRGGEGVASEDLNVLLE